MKNNLLLCMTIVGLISIESGCSSKEQILIYSAAEEERINYLQNALDNHFPNYNVVIQYTGTGNLYTKLLSEGSDTDCDIIYDFEANNSMNLYNQNSKIYSDLSDYDNSIYVDSLDPDSLIKGKVAVNGKIYGAVLINKKVLNEKSIAVPTTFDDLLDSKYKGLIEMPNPKSSGTGYCWYSGLVAKEGKDNALTYFSSLSNNIAEYTSSGAAPIKDVNRGDVAIGFGMLWQCLEYANSNSDLEVIYLDKGLPYNLYCMGMINGHEQRTPVKEVFDYLYYTLNPLEVCEFNPGKIYEKQGEPKIDNYPTTVDEIEMTNIFDFEFKQTLLDSWTF